MTRGTKDAHKISVATDLLDVVIALTALVILWPLIVLCILISSIETGSGIYSQVRVGRDGKHFTMYKIRTMKVSTPQAGTHQIDPSYVTTFGRVLRRSKVDELPQLVNVLFRDMSIVGPRPCLPTQTDVINARSKLGVDLLSPGLIGEAQINGIEMSEPIKLAEFDRQLMPLTLRKYLVVLLKTVNRGFFGDNLR